MKDYLSIAKQSAEYLKSKIGKPPLVSVVLGSGLGNLAKSISDKKRSITTRYRIFQNDGFRP